MIQIRIDNQHSTSVDIYVDISPSNPAPFPSSSSPISHDDEHIYNRLFDQSKISSLRQSKIVRNRTDYQPTPSKKHYTLQQILANVESIQEQYEQVTHHHQKTSPSCFFTFKQLTKILKSFKAIKPSKPKSPSNEKIDPETRSPFIFGGETLQWIALPHHYEDNPIYENM